MPYPPRRHEASFTMPADVSDVLDISGVWGVSDAFGARAPRRRGAGTRPGGGELMGGSRKGRRAGAAWAAAGS